MSTANFRAFIILLPVVSFLSQTMPSLNIFSRRSCYSNIKLSWAIANFRSQTMYFLQINKIFIPIKYLTIPWWTFSPSSILSPNLFLLSPSSFLLALYTQQTISFPNCIISPNLLTSSKFRFEQQTFPLHSHTLPLLDCNFIEFSFQAKTFLPQYWILFPKLHHLKHLC